MYNLIFPNDYNSIGTYSNRISTCEYGIDSFYFPIFAFTPNNIAVTALPSFKEYYDVIMPVHAIGGESFDVLSINIHC